MADPFKDWAILELMGHRKLAGLVSEETHFGVALCRIDPTVHRISFRLVGRVTGKVAA
jgi:hypothetical protein